MRSFTNVSAVLCIGVVCGASGAFAAQDGRIAIAPHRASYDLTLKNGSDELAGADGRIGFSIVRKGCDLYEFDYRFVARFQRDGELVVTDQRTSATEDLDMSRFTFEKETLVDGSPMEKVVGEAVTSDGKTLVGISEPAPNTVSIRAASFPMQHTIELIEHAKAGERIFESRIYDGDVDPREQLTSTSIIAPNHRGETKTETPGSREPQGDPATAGNAPAASQKLRDLDSWRISESFYNSDSIVDGLPIFQTTYTLYENGVSDDLELAFDGYTLAGNLTSLDLSGVPTCP